MKLPYPDLVDRDTRTPGMRHILSPAGRDRYWCGAPRNPERPPRLMHMSELECVVCADLLDANGPWWRQ